MEDLKFSPATHTYILPSGVLVPSVTEILKETVLECSSEWWTEEGRDKGRLVHAACAVLDGRVCELCRGEGVIPVAPLACPVCAPTEEIQDYVEAWQLAKQELGIEVLAVEALCYDPIRNVAGTYDRKAIIGGREGILEIKTGPPSRPDWWRLQLVAYSLMAWPDAEPHVRWAVRLDEDRTYQLYTYPPSTYLEDAVVWTALTHYYKWRINNDH